MSKEKYEVDFSNDEIERRRDRVIRQMANTPPQPKSNPPSHRPRKKTIAGEVQKAPDPGNS